MCETVAANFCVPCSSIVKPCVYKPQVVPVCPFSSCPVCQPKPPRCCCVNTCCQQISAPPPFPFENDPCPYVDDDCSATTPNRPQCGCPQVKSSPCLTRKRHDMRPSCLKMLEVHPVGRYVKIFNSSLNKTEHIGGWYLIQYCYGSPLSVFKFPRDATVPPQYRVKVWTACSDPDWLKLPTDHVFKELCFWNFGCGITTALYKPNGKPVTWLCGLEKFEPAPCYICYDCPQPCSCGKKSSCM